MQLQPNSHIYIPYADPLCRLFDLFLILMKIRTQAAVISKQASSDKRGRKQKLRQGDQIALVQGKSECA